MAVADGRLIGLILAGPAAAELDPATLDLASLIECKADIKTYNGLRSG